jgi:hypothetical protein
MSTRKVILCPGYGAGFATWNENGYALAESPGLIEYIENTEKDERDDKAMFDILLGEGLVTEGQYVCFLGLDRTVVITTVEPPYKITEYDGFERVEYPTGDDWRH